MKGLVDFKYLIRFYYLKGFQLMYLNELQRLWILRLFSSCSHLEKLLSADVVFFGVFIFYWISQNVLSEQIQGHNIDLMYSEIVQVSRTIHIKHMTTIIKCDLTLSEPKFILYIYNGVKFLFWWEILRIFEGYVRKLLVFR